MFGARYFNVISQGDIQHEKNSFKTLRTLYVGQISSAFYNGITTITFVETHKALFEEPLLAYILYMSNLAYVGFKAA